MHKIEIIYSYKAPLQVNKRIDDIPYVFGTIEEARNFLKIIKDHYSLVKTINLSGIDNVPESIKQNEWYDSEKPNTSIKYKGVSITAFWTGKYQTPLEARAYVVAKEDNTYTFK